MVGPCWSSVDKIVGSIHHLCPQEGWKTTFCHHTSRFLNESPIPPLCDSILLRSSGLSQLSSYSISLTLCDEASGQKFSSPICPQFFDLSSSLLLYHFPKGSKFFIGLTLSL